MGDIVSIIANEADKRPKHKACDFNRHQRELFGDVYRYGRWTRHRERKARRLKRWKLKWDGRWTAEIEAFALSRTMFDKGSSKLHWECTDVLGKGAFGIVGLWEQIDDSGYTVDSVAIKEFEDTEYMPIARLRDGGHVPMEAVATQELRKAWSVPRLRHLLALVTPSYRNANWRMYLEYCPHGTIRDLVKTYIAYNDKHEGEEQNIPEGYIWFIFHGFAVALYHMDRPEFTDTVGHPPGKRYMLHLDLKDENVMLGEPFKNRYLSKYPTVKVCDWGLASLTSEYDELNSSYHKRCGTVIWVPPEQYENNGFGARWRRPPHGGSNRPYLIGHTMWQMAAVIVGMMALDKDNRGCYGQMKQCDKDEQMCRDRDLDFFANTCVDGEEYSRELWSLLNECLNIDPRKRPSTGALLRSTEEGLRRVAKRTIDLGKEWPKVFYGENGVAQMEAEFKPGTKKRDIHGVNRRRRARGWEWFAT